MGPGGWGAGNRQRAACEEVTAAGGSRQGVGRSPGDGRVVRAEAHAALGDRGIAHAGATSASAFAEVRSDGGWRRWCGTSPRRHRKRRQVSVSSARHRDAAHVAARRAVRAPKAAAAQSRLRAGGTRAARPAARESRDGTLLGSSRVVGALRSGCPERSALLRGGWRPSMSVWQARLRRPRAPPAGADRQVRVSRVQAGPASGCRSCRRQRRWLA